MDAEDAEVGELCEFAPQHPVRWPETVSACFFMLGGSFGECYWLVSQSSWLWLLVIRN